MSARHATPRAIRKALDVLLTLPPEALADIAERMIDRLDAAEPDPDLEDDDADGCPAEDVSSPGHLGVGDTDDAEHGEPDEPSLGWPEGIRHSVYGPVDDRELDTADDEPSATQAPQHFGREVLGMEAWTGASL